MPRGAYGYDAPYALVIFGLLSIASAVVATMFWRQGTSRAASSIFYLWSFSGAPLRRVAPLFMWMHALRIRRQMTLYVSVRNPVSTDGKGAIAPPFSRRGENARIRRCRH
jgi:hypothetical protein